MAKGLRSKVKRRLRGARRAHFMKVQGYKDIERLHDRLVNPDNSIIENCKLKIKEKIRNFRVFYAKLEYLSKEIKFSIIIMIVISHKVIYLL